MSTPDTGDQAPTTPDPDLPRRVAVIGLGSMGAAMALTLQEDDWEVIGYDPSPHAQSAARAAGLALAESLDAVAGTPYVVLSLPSAAVVTATVPALLTRPGTHVVVDMTTSEPATSQRMAELTAAHGCSFIDAPVSGGRAGAATGALSAFVGGHPGAIRAAGPVLSTLTGGRVRVVGGPGAGNVVKLLNNVLCATNLIAVGEAMDVAAAYGLDVEVAAAAIAGASGSSDVIANAFPKWVFSGTFDSGFALGLMARDVALALDVASQQGATPAVLRATGTAWEHALAEAGPAADFVEAPATATTATTALSPRSLRAARGALNA